MCSRVLWCKSLFIFQWLLITMTTTSGSIKERNYEKELHVVSRSEDLNLEEFRSPLFGNYTTLYFMEGTLLVGARNSLLAFNTSGLKLIKNVSWIPSESSLQTSCIKSGISQDQCYNFIRVVTVFNNKLLTCGTNSHYPTCMWRNMKTLQLLSGTSPFFGKGFVPFNPHSKSVYTFSDNGRFFSALMMEFSGHDKAIVARAFSNYKPARQLRTLGNNLYWLDDPVFHKSFLIGEYIYFFFDEFARECSDCDAVRYSRIARICKGDDGGSESRLWLKFVTFQKARLNCSLSGPYPYYFNILRDVYWDAQTTTFYGIFTTERSYSFHTSAICSYSLSDVENVFNGKFKYKEGEVWQQKINPGHILQECKVNKNSIQYSTTPKKGRMQTASLRSKFIYEQSQCILTSETVQPRSNVTPFHLRNIRFFRVAIITFQTNHSEEEVWYIATDQGTILKLSRIPKIKEFCVFNEYEIFQNNKNEGIKAMELSPDKEYLIVGSDTKLIKVPLLQCDNYDNERSCLALQDPLCGWSTKKRKCIPWNKRENADWKQNITNCLQREAMWSEWSSWRECEKHDGNLCKCRRRLCINAREFYGCRGNDVELTNCTVNILTLTDKNEWDKNGVVHGGWSEWSSWTRCLRGYKNKSRTCTMPSPKGGFDCNGNDKDYTMCEPILFNDTKVFLWTSWNRVRGSERKVTRYKISCTSKALVMKTLKIDVVNNETINCNKDLCVESHKQSDSFMSNWGQWLSCNENENSTEKLRTRQLCATNLARQWSCGKTYVERKYHEDKTKPEVVHTTINPTIPEWSQWFPCVCDYDVITLNKSRGIQHRSIKQDGIRTEYRTCPCKVPYTRPITRINSSDVLGVVKNKTLHRDQNITSEYSLKMLIIIVSVACIICIIVTVVLLVLCHQKRKATQKINNNSSKNVITDESNLSNGKFTSTGV